MDLFFSDELGLGAVMESPLATLAAMVVAILVLSAVFRVVLRVGFAGLMANVRGVRAVRKFTTDHDLRHGIEQIGTGGVGDKTLTHTEYRTSLGVRLGTLVGIAAILYMICPQLPGETLPGLGDPQGGLRMEGFTLNGDYAWPIFAVIALVTLAYTVYLWRFRVEIDGPILTFSKFLGGRESHDLRQLTRIEDPNRGMIRLHFEDGRKTHFLKHVRGMEDMLTRLRAYRGQAAMTP